MTPPPSSLPTPSPTSSTNTAGHGVGVGGRLLSPERLARWPRLLAAFLGGQVMFQAITMVTGFLVLRWLSADSKVPYAQYALAISIQASLAGIVELGFPGAVSALVGARKDDRALVGAYVRAAQGLRDLLLAVATPVALAILVVLGLRQGWSPALLASMAACVAVMVYVQGQTVFPAMALHMHRDMRGTYGGQIAWSLLRLGTLAGVMALGWITVHWALWTSAVAAVLVCLGMRWSARGLMTIPTASDPGRRAEVLAFMAPLVPTHVFSVLQPQLVVLLASVFGASATIAEVGALGRIGALFTIIHMFHSILVFHYFARMEPGRVARNYAAAVLVSIGYLVVIVVLAFEFPQPLLWLLGSGYAHLRSEVGWMVIASAAMCLQHLMWTIHFARRWVYWWFSWTNIGLCLGVQIVSIALIDVSTTHGAVMFAVWSSVALLAAQVLLVGSRIPLGNAARQAD